MKLSIWQQFSSNHSASYSIVAVFATKGEAEAARVWLTGILQKIADWYAEDEKRLYDDSVGVSPIEAEIAKSYEIEWNEPLLWFENTMFKVADRLLIIEPAYPTDSGTEAIEALLKKLKAEVAVDGGYDWNDTRIGIVEIRCRVASEAIAKRMLEAYQGRFEADSLSLILAPQRVLPLDKFLKAIRDLQAEGCSDIQIFVRDKPLIKMKTMDDFS